MNYMVWFLNPDLHIQISYLENLSKDKHSSSGERNVDFSSNSRWYRCHWQTVVFFFIEWAHLLTRQPAIKSNAFWPSCACKASGKHQWDKRWGSQSIGVKKSFRQQENAVEGPKDMVEASRVFVLGTTNFLSLPWN